jgi:hypothetical protein
MLLQTNSYIVPKDKRAEHARLLRRFRATLAKLGCDSFEVYEQVGSNWSTGEPTGRYVQIMRFRDRRHQLAVQAAERSDSVAQAIIAEFCQLINFPYQQQQGLFAVGFYHSVLPAAPARPQPAGEGAAVAEAAGAAEEEAADQAAAASDVVEEYAVEEAAAAEAAPEADEPAGDLESDHAEAVQAELAVPGVGSPEAETSESLEGVAEEGSEADAVAPDPDEMDELLESHLDAEEPRAEHARGLDQPAGVDGAALEESPESLDALDIDLPGGSGDHADSARRHVAR